MRGKGRGTAWGFLHRTSCTTRFTYSRCRKFPSSKRFASRLTANLSTNGRAWQGKEIKIIITRRNEPQRLVGQSCGDMWRTSSEGSPHTHFSPVCRLTATYTVPKDPEPIS
jgi:hypothetical protein